MPAQKNNAIARKLGLKKYFSAMNSLMIVLREELSREELLNSFAFIKRYNSSSDYDLKLMQAIEEAMENSEPHQLESFALISQWKSLSSELAEEGPYEPAIYWIQSWNQAFEVECYLSLLEIYGGTSNRSRDPKCPDFLLNEFPKAMEEGLNKKALELWGEMLVLWSLILKGEELRKVEECMSALPA
jgi:type II restriction/modification system DNA methylase subunit YeeA